MMNHGGGDEDDDDDGGGGGGDAVKRYNMGTPALLPVRRKVCCGFLSPLKNPSPRPGLNPRPLGPVASTLTTTPPRRLLPSYV
jgi:hypothetical protein